MRLRRRRRFGAVRQLPSGRWQARYLDEEGSQYAAPNTFPTEAAADRFLAGVETDMARGTWRDPRLGSVMLRDWAAEFLTTKGHLKPKTLESYHSLLRSRILPEFGDAPIGDIKTSHVKRWASSMAAEGLSASRRRQALLLLREMFDLAIADRCLEISPCDGVPLPTLPRPVQDYLTAEEVDRLAETVPPRFRLLV